MQGFAAQAWPLGNPAILQATVVDFKVALFPGGGSFHRAEYITQDYLQQHPIKSCNICYSLTPTIRNNLIAGLTPQRMSL